MRGLNRQGRRGVGAWTVLISVCLLGSGCSQDGPVVAEPDYARPLDPGGFGLTRLSTAAWPDVIPVVQQMDDRDFAEALERSRRWYGAPSTRQFFPVGPIAHGHAWASVYALQQIAQLPESQREQVLRSDFDVWMSVGWNGSGEVLFTGYYSPIFNAAYRRQGAYQYPLYRRPSDLASDSDTGEVLGRRLGDGRLVPYPTRAQIEADPAALGLTGSELVWMASELDRYIVQVNGSARLQMVDGPPIDIGFAGTNGAEYTSIGQILAQDGSIPADRVSLFTIRDYFAANPSALSRYLNQNDRYVFFTEYEPGLWPAGSLGFRVTDGRTLATDKAIFPRGAAVFVDTTLPDASGSPRPYRQLMVDQDTGGAIRAAGRADIYIGVGPQAEIIAGRQAAEGRMYYLFLKPDRVHDWYARMMNAGAQASSAR